jgi:hypothetical protein
MSGTQEGFTGSSVATLEMTDMPAIVPAMCEDCACPKPNATAEGRAEVSARGTAVAEVAGGAVIAAAVFVDEQMPVTFAITGSAEL